MLFSVDPATMGKIVDLGVLAGRIEDMGASDIAVHDTYAQDHGLAVDDTVEVTFAETGTKEFRVGVIFERNQLLQGNPFFISNPAYEANYSDLFDFQVYVLRSPDADPATVRSAVEETASRYANAEVQDLTEYKQSQAEQIDQFLNLIYALLFLAVVIALIGIANTLALSIIERTRELGLLRAVGMTRRQLRRSVRLESVLIALLGTFLGGAVGVFFGWAMVQALADQGFTEFVIPIAQVLVIVVLAVIAGVAAAVLPARRASKLDVLRAIGSS
jgi:putative ABC transport system permease protein